MAEKITIVIETGTSAFEDTPATEVARILRKVAADYEAYGGAVEQLRDINGNKVGQVVVEEIE